ncbi:MAG: Uma2 family endonuclease [Oscillatoriaceae cyanobacterium Prado104]|nr:Uma2 family endonuclease [Oscillatoriaceae cyanobacterium Prado104]
MTGYQHDPQHPQTKVLPTMYDLPSENPEDPGLEVFHRVQAQLTSDSCIPLTPLIVAEFIPDSTEYEDLDSTYSEHNKPPTKWQVYERILKKPYYIIFNKNTNQLKVFRLVGNRYREQVLPDGKFWIPELELSIGLWFGYYRGCSRLWLRWYDVNGNLVLTPEESQRERAELASQRAELERQRAESERARAETERERADRLEAILRAMNINPDEL